MKITLITMPPLVNASYRSGKGRFYKSALAKSAQNAMQWEAKSQYRGRPLTKDLVVTLGFYYNDKRKRDIDSGIKSTLDAMTGILWVDDRQIRELHVVKGFATKPHVDIVFE